jgi:hypothetical protein
VAIAWHRLCESDGSSNGQGGPMIGEREEAADAFLCAAAEKCELANVWAAVLTLCLFIACTVTLGVWLFRYHQEAESMQPYLSEPTSAMELILEDCLLRM